MEDRCSCNNNGLGKHCKFKSSGAETTFAQSLSGFHPKSANKSRTAPNNQCVTFKTGAAAAGDGETDTVEEPSTYSFQHSVSRRE